MSQYATLYEEGYEYAGRDCELSNQQILVETHSLGIT